MPARSRQSPCCRSDYTTERLDPVTGAVVWRANLYKIRRRDWLVGKFVACEYLYEVGDTKMLIVGGVRGADRDPDSPSVTWRDVAAFDYDTGALLWEFDCTANCVGYDEEEPSATPDTVMCIAKDSDDNIVCMLRRFNSAGGGVADYFYHEDAHWITLDTAGALVDAKTFARQTSYDGSTITPISFDIDSSGFYHIVGVDYDGDDAHPIRGGSEFQFFYGWSSFASPPTLYEVELAGGVPIKCTPSSLVRYADQDWMGGRSTHWPLGPTLDGYNNQFLTGAFRSADANLVDEWSDVDVTLSKRHESFYDVDVLPAGISQGTAAALTNNANNKLEPFINISLTPFQGVILPDGVQGDVLSIDSVRPNTEPFFRENSHIYSIYPPVGGRVILDFVRYIPDVDVGVLIGLDTRYMEWLYIPIIKCTCLGDDGDGYNTWLIEYTSIPIVCNLPYPGSGLDYTVGRFGLIVKWLDGEVYSWTDCDRVQAIADSEGNTFGIGSRTGIYIAETLLSGTGPTISKRDNDGVFQWAHRHASSLNFNQARLMHLSADESALFVSGSYDFGGPLSNVESEDYVADNCIVEEVCDGFCKYVADTDTTVEIDEHTGTYTFSCHAIVTVEAWAGGGGGGGASGATKGAGGGGQGEGFTALWHVLKGTVLSWGVDPSSTGEGQGGVGPDGQDGRDGTNLRVWTALTDPLFILQGGYGGKGTQNLTGTAPAGGLAGGAFSADGDPGADYLGGDGGGFGFTGGDSGKGATGNAFGNVDPPIAGGLNGGGGGGGYDSDGADGGGQHFKMSIQYLKWIVDETPGSSDCETGCACRDVDEIFTDQFGCPFNLDATIDVRCSSG